MITLHICLSITFELQVQEGGTQTEPCIEETGKPEWGDRIGGKCRAEFQREENYA